MNENNILNVLEEKENELWEEFKKYIPYLTD
jgi:hypothetical protein